MQPTAHLPPPILSPWQMFASAGPVVQTVMSLLVLASVLSWTILVVKLIELSTARRRLARSVALVRGATGLASLRDGAQAGELGAMLREIDAERTHSADLPAAGVKERIPAVLRQGESGFSRRMARGTSILASIGASAPFVGLFGTVWGIMTSFIGISQSQTTNLAVVAPGIAEALLATAFGLGAAIPAVLIYNFLARALTGYRAGVHELGARLQVIACRDLDRDEAGRTRSWQPRLRSAAE
jgi:biopolymer transport protein ExbB